jgi:PAS domain S-box-containing protein
MLFNVERFPPATSASEELLRHLVDHAPDLIYSCDADGRFTFVNVAATRVLRYEEGELIGRHVLTLVRPDFRAEAAALYARQVSEQIPSTYFEFPALTKTGTLVWIGQYVQIVLSGDAVVAINAVARDITRQKGIEDRLKQSESRYRSLIHDAAYGIFLTNAAGTILEANPALARMLGYASVDELKSVGLSAIYKSRQDLELLIERSGRGSDASKTTDVIWLRRDGTEIIVHLSARSVTGADGTVSFEGIAEDITEKHALEEQLRRAQKMEAVGRLARGVAHDFNNVLAAILGTADLLRLRLASDDPSAEDAEEIRKAAERGADLTRQLLAFSRSQMLDPQLLDLNVVVPALQSMLQRLVGSLAAIEVRTADRPATVRVERGQLEQVLLNLVVNARDAMPPAGGRIDICVSVVDLDPTGVLPYPGIPAGRYVRLAVADTGVGIDPDLQDHIFEPFFTTKGPSKGTGLGLSIVYSIARDAGGSVTFATTPGAGTTFEVMLPYVIAPTTGASPSQVSGS